MNEEDFSCIAEDLAAGGEGSSPIEDFSGQNDEDD